MTIAHQSYNVLFIFYI